jgi:hypothetical protein
MENKEYGSVIGPGDAPYTNALARRYTLLTNEYAITHPSLPNYLALIAGSTFGVSSDCTDCYQNGLNLVDQLEAKGVSWKAYMQDMPAPCYQGAFGGNYAKKHNPFMYFDDIRGNSERCHKIVPFTELSRDLKDGSLPRFSFITPNLCNDTHDCPVSVGDRFLRSLLPELMRALRPRGIVILTYDEGDTDAGCCAEARGGHVATIIAGPGATRRERITTQLDHYSLLKLIEDQWGLAHLGRAASPSTPTVPGFGFSRRTTSP